MPRTHGLGHPGVSEALGAAILFGSSTPLAKLLLAGINPWVLAGLLYLGSGLGLAMYRFAIHARTGTVPPRDRPWLIGAILSGGVIAPVLLMLGLSALAASKTSLLLNAEGVFTALLAWFVFRENVDRRIALGMTAIIAGAVMAIGIWLHLSEQHMHPHSHASVDHGHEHDHANDHNHTHDHPVPPCRRHSHAHRHEPVTHSHMHYPDTHHRHDH